MEQDSTSIPSHPIEIVAQPHQQLTFASAHLVLVVRGVVDERHQLRSNAVGPQSVGDRRQAPGGRHPEVDVIRLEVLDQHCDLCFQGLFRAQAAPAEIELRVRHLTTEVEKGFLLFFTGTGARKRGGHPAAAVPTPVRDTQRFIVQGLRGRQIGKSAG